MAHQNAAVYVHGEFSEPMSAQHNFFIRYDIENLSPEQAMSHYSRVMHQHTQHQLESATSSARRRSAASTASGLSTESMNSTPRDS